MDIEILMIREAIDIREGKKKSAYPFKIIKMVEDVYFLKHITRLRDA
jgi:hypothetical protein